MLPSELSPFGCWKLLYLQIPDDQNTLIAARHVTPKSKILLENGGTILNVQKLSGRLDDLALSLT